MTLRAFSAWLLILVMAILNGALRQTFLTPSLGEALGHVVSTMLLALLVLVASWLLIPWIRPSNIREAWLIGTFWAFLTLGFEFIAGHYVFGNTWQELFADYNLAAGRIWILVPVTTLFAPVLVLSKRGNNG